MTEGNKAQDTATEEKKPSRFKAARPYIFHGVLVLVLFFFLAWQVLDFYSLSTESNRARAVKTKHMLVFDLETGLPIANLPKHAVTQEEEPQTAEHEPAPVEPAKETEVAVVIAGIGKDTAYTTEVITLPPEFIFAFSPYGTKPLESSKFKSAEGAGVIAEVVFEGGKFDISATNTDFRNINNAKAAISKIYDAQAVYVSAPESFIATDNFSKLAQGLNENDVLVLTPTSYSGASSNVITADVFVKAVTPPDQIRVALLGLEKAAQTDGYAIAVIEPQPGVANVLKEWSATLHSKKIKLTPAIKN